MYKRIMVALDHSDVDDVLLAHAEGLAKALGSVLVLYRVAHYHTRDSRTHEMSEAEEYLAKLEERIKASGVNCETAIGQGEPAHAISEDAESLRCDLIAMGTHGHSSLLRFVLGSVAEDLKRISSIPILIVPRRSASRKKP